MARRVVSRLRPTAKEQDDLLQQAVITSIDLLRRFHPRTDPQAPPPREQAERYLYVSLQWNLRAYARRLRSSVPVPDSDRRLAHAYAKIAALQESLPIEDAAKQLGVQVERLTAALAASDYTISLDRPGFSSDESNAVPLGEQLADEELGPEDALIAEFDEQQAILLRHLADTFADQESTDSSAKRRRQQTRQLVHYLLEQLGRGDAEVIRLVYALPRKELDTLRSCRTYGCRQDAGHEHSSTEIARWLQADPEKLARRLRDSLETLDGLLGGRDSRRLLADVSAIVATKS